MPTGSTKSLHFHEFEELEKSNRSPVRRKLDPRMPTEPERAPSDAPAPDLNPLLAMGSLLKDHQLTGDKLKALHLDPDAYHGHLQVVLSALKRMQAHVSQMIEQCERI